MVAVHREHGLRFVIFTDDHEPAHVHVFGDGEAKIDLIGIDGEAELVWTVGLSKADVRRAMRVVMEQRAMLLDQWREIHG